MCTSGEIINELETRPALWPSYPTPGNTVKGNDIGIPKAQFITALLTAAELWCQPGCPPTEESENVVHVSGGIPFSHKKKAMMPFAVNP